ncbi:hypothetical protein J3F83DRAFT_717671 [Trichoderma novae-zelandiae]
MTIRKPSIARPGRDKSGALAREGEKGFGSEGQTRRDSDWQKQVKRALLEMSVSAGGTVLKLDNRKSNYNNISFFCNETRPSYGCGHPIDIHKSVYTYKHHLRVIHLPTVASVTRLLPAGLFVRASGQPKVATTTITTTTATTTTRARTRKAAPLERTIAIKHRSATIDTTARLIKPNMLLPSAFSCDGGSQAASLPRSQPARIASPPSSPSTLSAQYSIDNIMNTCRSLQSLISMTASGTDHGALAPAPTLTQLPTPPLAHAPTPMKLRLRARPAKTTDGKGDETPVARKRIARRAPPRGANKRRRADSDDMGRDDDDGSGMDSEAELDAEAPHDMPSLSSSSPQAPSTPKRARISPEQLPLGLERADFHNVHLQEGSPALDQSARKPGTDVQVEADGAEWSVEDDRVLVELVLEKLKLSKMEWQDCARSLGKDRHSVNRRWKSLVMNGDVGVKTRNRRARLHSTWRC